MQYKTAEDQIREQKNIAEKLLIKLEQFGFENSVCAGGAPRDWFLGRLAKDLDFFVDKSSGSLKFNFDSFMSFLNIKTYQKLENSGIYESNPRLDSVYEFIFENQVCQLIIVQDAGIDTIPTKAVDIYKTFPVNVSKIAYYKDSLGDFTFIKTEDFYFAHKFKIIDFNEEGLYNEYYRQKIRRKFKDYALVYRRKEGLAKISF